MDSGLAPPQVGFSRLGQFRRRSRASPRSVARPGMTADGSMPAATALTPSTGSLPARGLVCVDHAGAIRAHEAFDRGVQVVPGRVDEIVIAHREGRTDEEFFVG